MDIRCEICGGHVTRTKGYQRKTCSPECLFKHNGQRASARMKRLHQDPEFQKARDARSRAVFEKLWQRQDFVERQKTIFGPANAARMYADADTMERRGEINGAILRYATRAIMRSNEFRQLLSERTRYYREIHPYNEAEHGHYNRDYTAFISSLTATDPAVRKMHDDGMKQKIPEAVALYREGKLPIRSTHGPCSSTDPSD